MLKKLYNKSLIALSFLTPGVAGATTSSMPETSPDDKIETHDTIPDKQAETATIDTDLLHKAQNAVGDTIPILRNDMSIEAQIADLETKNDSLYQENIKDVEGLMDRMFQLASPGLEFCEEADMEEIQILADAVVRSTDPHEANAYLEMLNTKLVIINEENPTIQTELNNMFKHENPCISTLEKQNEIQEKITALQNMKEGLSTKKQTNGKDVGIER